MNWILTHERNDLNKNPTFTEEPTQIPLAVNSCLSLYFLNPFLLSVSVVFIIYDFIICGWDIQVCTPLKILLVMYDNMADFLQQPGWFPMNTD